MAGMHIKRLMRAQKTSIWRAADAFRWLFPPSATAPAVPLWRFNYLQNYKGPKLILRPSFFAFRSPERNFHASRKTWHALLLKNTGPSPISRTAGASAVFLLPVPRAGCSPLEVFDLQTCRARASLAALFFCPRLLYRRMANPISKPDDITIAGSR